MEGGTFGSSVSNEAEQIQKCGPLISRTSTAGLLSGEVRHPSTEVGVSPNGGILPRSGGQDPGSSRASGPSGTGDAGAPDESDALEPLTVVPTAFCGGSSGTDFSAEHSNTAAIELPGGSDPLCNSQGAEAVLESRRLVDKRSREGEPCQRPPYQTSKDASYVHPAPPLPPPAHSRQGYPDPTASETSGTRASVYQNRMTTKITMRSMRGYVTKHGAGLSERTASCVGKPRVRHPPNCSREGIRRSARKISLPPPGGRGNKRFLACGHTARLSRNSEIGFPPNERSPTPVGGTDSNLHSGGASKPLSRGHTARLRQNSARTTRGLLGHPPIQLGLLPALRRHNPVHRQGATNATLRHGTPPSKSTIFPCKTCHAARGNYGQISRGKILGVSRIQTRLRN